MPGARRHVQNMELHIYKRQVVSDALGEALVDARLLPTGAEVSRRWPRSRVRPSEACERDHPHGGGKARGCLIHCGGDGGGGLR